MAEKKHFCISKDDKIIQAFDNAGKAKKRIEILRAEFPDSEFRLLYQFI